ncbi:aspartate kinase [Acidaminobacter sp. JC074]|uniref:aspartate kinase n=1 Tax=Acidaminobacter sp. JC074 TaxID=2530199 RepID=UPI001F10913A|nr:aspartate kinase [Acidaminobacter sp. JC074]MCH4890919.1 aspartate kinase [Acidaminobacter sp. JC074]
MSIVVQKYGGTSVRTESSREMIINNVKSMIKKDKQVVLVVSAIGRNGAPYATDTLINMVNGIGIEANPREMDMLMSCGETISSVVLANTLKFHGIDAVALTGFQAGILTTSNFNSANIVNINPERILHFLGKNKVVVVAGFQGMDSEGDITTLGRGGSDTTAAALGEALNAELIEIYTDVDGIMTADPRIVEKANVLESVTYDEIYQMAVYGAKVVDHNAVAIARRARKPLVIKNTFSSAEGTVIADEAQLKAMLKESKKLITAITSHDNVIQVNIEEEGSKSEALLNALEDHQIAMDMINFTQDRKIFTVAQKRIDDLTKILEDLSLKYSYSEECSKLTVVGYKIHVVPGIIKRTVFALTKSDIEILQSTDSNTTISFLVGKDDAQTAVKVLHEEFDL